MLRDNRFAEKGDYVKYVRSRLHRTHRRSKYLNIHTEFAGARPSPR